MENQELTGVSQEREQTEFQEKIPLANEFIEILEDQGLEAHAEAYRTVVAIAEDVEQAGGQVLLVGGSVRDMMMGKISKDYDIEVYGIEPEQIEEIVQKHGKVSDVGKAFGILKVALGDGMDIDVSLPRIDSKTGEGHKGFDVKADPSMSIEDAALRRDFTMNSISANPLTGELHDPFGGVEDIKKRVLKITDAERFQDDPLRIMRAIQFIGRFGMSLDIESARLIQDMVPELKELPKERIFEEWKKLLTKSEKPSLGLAAGMSLGVLNEIHPQFPPLVEAKQEPEWHPEGDTWIHTLMSVDSAAEVCDMEELDTKSRTIVMLATLCHDLGKASTTEYKDGRFKSHGHEKAGEKPTLEFLDSMGVDHATRDKVVKLVINHMTPSMLYVSKVINKETVKDGAIRRLAKRIHPATIQELVAVAMSDHMGRGPFMDPDVPEQMLLPDGFPAGPWLLKWSRELGVEESQPVDLIRGKELITLGYRPGKDFGVIIGLANDLRDEKEFTREQVLELLLDVDNEEAIKKLTKVLN